MTPEFYSVWCEYGATGEGNTAGVMYCTAVDKADLEQQIVEAFGIWLSQFVEYEVGIKTNDFFEKLAPPFVIKHYTNMQSGAETRPGRTCWYSVYHINYS